MPWVKIDDHFNEHPKMAAVGPVGWGIWLAGLAYCNRNLTDGFIPRSIASALGGDWSIQVPETRDGVDGFTTWDIARTQMMGDDNLFGGGENMETEWIIDRLIQEGLWIETHGGYLVHDYEEYQPTKAEVIAQRRAKQAAGQAGGRASAQARGQANGAANAQAKSNPVPVPVPVIPVSVPSAKAPASPEEIEAAITANRVIIQDPNSTSVAKRAAEHALSKMGVGMR